MSQRRLSKKDAPKNLIDDEKVLGDNDFIVSKTDTKGFITYCNQIFIDMAGWSAEELIGANHNIIRHPDMPRIAFKAAWDLIKAKKEFFGFVKNLRKNGGFYWVFAYITADIDSRGNIVGYTSFRRKPPRSAIAKIEPVYKLLLDAESRGGMEASGKLLNQYLADNKVTYDEFVINLQKDIKV
jgi:PAS domain S-box-containing protein